MPPAACYPQEYEHDPIPCLTPQPLPPPLTSNPTDVALLLHTITFATNKHAFQRRKDPACTPYINHPIGVCNYIAQTGVTDTVVLRAAILHDVLEDTQCTKEELEAAFGKEVAHVVEECSDDTTLSGPARKRAQLASCSGKSGRAHQVKLADKLHNLLSIQSAVLVGWTVRRVQAYVIWAKQVTDICAYSNPALAAQLNELYTSGVFEFEGKRHLLHPEFGLTEVPDLPSDGKKGKNGNSSNGQGKKRS